MVVGLVLTLSSCTAGVSNFGVGPAAVFAGLQRFSGCDDFLAYVKGHALDRVGPYGLPGGQGGYFAFESDVAAADSAAGSDGALSPAASSVDPYSTTNVQTEGVDEPDIVKTDGERMLVLAQNRLFVIDLTGDSPELRGTLELDEVWIRDMVMQGDRVLLLGESAEGGGGFASGIATDVVIDGYGGGITALVEVDISDPADPTVARKLLVDGRYLSTRMIDGVARIVVSSFPTGLEFAYPEGGGLQAEREAERKNREVIQDSTLENWVPYFVLEDGEGETLSEGSLLDCESAHHAEEFSGFGMLTVLTVDLAEGLTDDASEESAGVLSDGETVYASAGSLYVATQRWIDWQALEAADESEREAAADSHVTQIHRFDISGEGGAIYRSTGEVTGWLLSQFSMDEHQGHLRVASTDSPPFWSTDSSESRVTVLAEREGVLEQVGMVDGLGEGEQIYAVRFMGDLGYVVTFRQVDPLYVIDLADPAQPSVSGELKILGYSAYLHPIGDDLLLGVGQDATEEGVTKGTQLSVFDVTDPSAPALVDQVQVAGGSSDVEWDHHAFLYWEGLVVLPLNVYAWDEETGQDESFYGALAVRFHGDELGAGQRLSQDAPKGNEWSAGIRRSLVIGERLYTVSDLGVEAVDLETLEDAGWVPFS